MPLYGEIRRADKNRRQERAEKHIRLPQRLEQTFFELIFEFAQACANENHGADSLFGLYRQCLLEDPVGFYPVYSSLNVDADRGSLPRFHHLRFCKLFLSC